MTLPVKIRRLFEWLIAGLLASTLLLWLPNAHAMFWWRRSSLFAAGVIALVYLAVYCRSKIGQVPHTKILFSFLALSSVLVPVRSVWPDGLIGRPLVHPALLSLLSAVSIGIFLQTVPRLYVLKGYFYIVLWWALVCLLFWANETSRGRLGFVDSQVIYASYLFMTGIIIGHWLWREHSIGRHIAAWGIGFLAICLVLSQTRSALVITLVYFSWCYRRQVMSKFGLWVVMGLVLAAVLVGVHSPSRLSSVSYLDESITYRWHLVQASLPKKTGDWLLGGGVRSIESNITTHARKYPDLAPDIQRAVRFESSHNYLVDIIVERGLVVATLFVCLVVAALRNRSKKEQLAKGLLVSSLAYLFFNNINLQMELMTVILIIWLVCPLTGKSQTAYATHSEETN